MDKRRTDEQVINNEGNNTQIRVISSKVTPGPSDYSVLQSSVIGKDGPSYTWQQKTPQKDRKKDFPAPGHYNHQSALSRISYSFQRKYKQKLKSQWEPGPG